jgi:hypothetical protein
MKLQEWFWSRVQKSSGCWNWTGSLTSNGYGKIERNKHILLAHRLSFKLKNGSIPDHLIICHRCNNKKCVRPGHLYAGTHRQNREDAIRDGAILPKRPSAFSGKLRRPVQMVVRWSRDEVVRVQLLASKSSMTVSAFVRSKTLA